MIVILPGRLQKFFVNLFSFIFEEMVIEQIEPWKFKWPKKGHIPWVKIQQNSIHTQRDVTVYVFKYSGCSNTYNISKKYIKHNFLTSVFRFQLTFCLNPAAFQ